MAPNSPGKPDLRVFPPPEAEKPQAAPETNQKPRGRHEQRRMRLGVVDKQDLALAARAMAEEKHTTTAQATGLLLLMSEQKYLEWVAKGKAWQSAKDDERRKAQEARKKA